MVSIYDGRQFLLYGGSIYKQGWQDKIWRYKVAEDSWEVIGTMKTAREEHVVLPVENFHC
jgi:hypothetical protein